MPGKILIALFLASAFLFPAVADAQTVNFKEIEAKVREFRGMLDQAGVNGTRFWTRLDSSKRPHRLYVGDGFMSADDEAKESFIEVFLAFSPAIRKRTCSSTYTTEAQASSLVSTALAVSGSFRQSKASIVRSCQSHDPLFSIAFVIAASRQLELAGVYQ